MRRNFLSYGLRTLVMLVRIIVGLGTVVVLLVSVPLLLLSASVTIVLCCAAFLSMMAHITVSLIGDEVTSRAKRAGR